MWESGEYLVYEMAVGMIGNFQALNANGKTRSAAVTCWARDCECHSLQDLLHGSVR